MKRYISNKSLERIIAAIEERITDPELLEDWMKLLKDQVKSNNNEL